jgi:hypothetical protein
VTTRCSDVWGVAFLNGCIALSIVRTLAYLNVSLQRLHEILTTLVH